MAVRTKGITSRWFRNCFCVVAAVLCVFASFIIVAVRSYYYDYVRQTLETGTGDLVSTYFGLYLGDSDETFTQGAVSFVENYSDRSKMEIWVISSDGSVAVSSSGFEIPEDVKMPDYEEAKVSETDVGSWTGRIYGDEKVMATTCMLPGNHGNEAVRYIVSLRNVDGQLVKIAFLSFSVVILILVIFALTSMLFLRSIVRPVQAANDTAKIIASGDLSPRIPEYENNDEISDLCSTINFMASELGESEKMKNDFISTVSHELRTPLTAIKGWGETLLQLGGVDQEMNAKGMHVIIDESQRLSEMVEELLDFSRMQNGDMRLKIEKMDVLAELDEAVYMFKERATRKGLEVIYNAPTLPAPIQGDPNRIKQVFLNILDNSIKYTDQGGKIIVLAEIEGSTLTIDCTDTGCGIKSEDLPRVKEKFFKANVSVRGSGIGLAVANEIVRLHNGELIVSSIFGEGTTVTVILPIDPVQPEERGTDDE